MARNLKYYGMDLPPKFADLINETMRKLSERAFYGTPFNDESPASCSDCPPEGYPTDKTRCAEHPRKAPRSAKQAKPADPALSRAISVTKALPDAQRPWQAFWLKP
jgi:hypothetical protein